MRRRGGGPPEALREAFSDAAAAERSALVDELDREARDQELPNLVAMQRRRRYLAQLQDQQDADLKRLLTAKSARQRQRVLGEVLARSADPLTPLRAKEREAGILMNTATLALDRPEDVAVFADCLVVTRLKRLHYPTDTVTIPFHAIESVADEPAGATLRRVSLTTTDQSTTLTLPRADAAQLLVILEAARSQAPAPTAEEPAPSTPDEAPPARRTT